MMEPIAGVEICADCDGKGLVNKVVCKSCYGSGVPHLVFWKRHREWLRHELLEAEAGVRALREELKLAEARIQEAGGNSRPASGQRKQEDL
jgi:hypothetical protein